MMRLRLNENLTFLRIRRTQYCQMTKTVKVKCSSKPRRGRIITLIIIHGHHRVMSYARRWCIQRREHGDAHGGHVTPNDGINPDFQLRKGKQRHRKTYGCIDRELVPTIQWRMQGMGRLIKKTMGTLGGKLITYRRSMDVSGNMVHGGHSRPRRSTRYDATAKIMTGKQPKRTPHPERPEHSTGNRSRAQRSKEGPSWRATDEMTIGG